MRLTLILVFFCCAFTAWGQNDYQDAYSLGVEALEQKDYGTAIKHFEKAVSINDRHLDAPLRLVQCAILKEDLETLQEALSQLKKLNYNQLDASVYVAYAQIAYSKKQYGLAIKAAKEGLTMDKKNIDLQLVTALSYKEERQWEEAIAAFKNCINTDANRAAFHAEIASIYMMQNDWANAELAYKNLLKVDPKSQTALIHLGKFTLDAFQKNNDSSTLEKAIGYYTTYTEHYPKDAKVWQLLSDLYKASGQEAKHLDAQKKANSLK